MRLDFSVLWIEDQPDAVAAQISAIKTKMRDEGFEFRPIQCRSLQQTQEYLGAEVFNDGIDLVLVDWDLGGDIKGQEAIAAVRERIPYKDVIFYSASNNARELRRLAFDAGLEGIYCSTRTDLVDEVTGVFESLIKKVLDLDHTRGIVMGATSDIDHLIKEIVSAAHAKIEAPDQKKMVAEAITTIEDRLQENTAELAKLKKDGTLEALFKKHMLCTANDRLRILSRLLENEKLKAHSGSRASVVKYLDDVVPKRNVLGHKVLLPDGKTTAVALIEGANTINLDEMRELRRLILDLRHEFRSLLDAILAV